MYNLDMTGFEFPTEFLIYESKPQAFASQISIYTPSQLLTRICVHADAVIALDIDAFVSGAYTVQNDWRFLMDNYSVLMMCFQAVGDFYTQKIWDTMISMLAIVASLSLVLCLALVGQVYLIFEPLLRTATMASGTLLRKSFKI